MIRAVVLSLMLANISFASEHACPNQTKVHKENGLKKLRLKVEKALGVGNEKVIRALAACDFMLGPPETDIGGFRNASKITKQLAALLKAYKFDKVGEEYTSQVTVHSLSPTHNYELIYRKDDVSGWYWAGLNIDEPKVLDNLLIGAYQLR